MTELLMQQVKTLLAETGFPVTEGFPNGPSFRPEQVTLAVLPEGLAPEEGLFRVEIRVLSPRKLGGFSARDAAAKTAEILFRGGFTPETGKMEYLAPGDCFEIPLRAQSAAGLTAEGWKLCGGIRVRVGDREIFRLAEFSARQDSGRRPIMPLNQSLPAGITPGWAAGWEIRLVQNIPAGENVPGPDPEPFSLQVLQNGRTTVYRDCCWSGEELQSTREMTRLVRRGFALSREVQHG